MRETRLAVAAFQAPLKNFFLHILLSNKKISLELGKERLSLKGLLQEGRRGLLQFEDYCIRKNALWGLCLKSQTEKGFSFIYKDEWVRLEEMNMGKWMKEWSDETVDQGMFSLWSVNAQDIQEGLLC